MHRRDVVFYNRIMARMDQISARQTVIDKKVSATYDNGVTTMQQVLVSSLYVISQQQRIFNTRLFL